MLSIRASLNIKQLQITSPTLKSKYSTEVANVFSAKV